MKTLLYTLILLSFYYGNAQFQLHDFDVKTTDISTLRYTKFERKLANDAGTYFKAEEVVLIDKPVKEEVSFDSKGYLTIRISPFANKVYTYSKNYTESTTVDTKTNTTYINTLVPIEGRFVFEKPDEIGIVERDASNRVTKINNTKYPNQSTTVQYQDGSYTIKEAFLNRTYAAVSDKEIINHSAGADYQYYNANNAVELNIRVNYTYVSNYDFYVYEYDAKGNWTTKIHFLYTNTMSGKIWRLEGIIYRDIAYKDGSRSKPNMQIETDRKKYMALGATLPIIEYNPQKNGYASYIGKTDLLNLKTSIQKESKKEAIEDKTSSTTDICLAGDCKDGYGKKKINNSDVQAIFSKSKLNAFGTQVFDSGTYQGHFSNGKRDGYGIYTWNDSNKTHIGTWQDGLQDGFGIVMQGDEIIQAGEYVAGKQTLNYLKPFESKETNGNCIGNCSNGFGKLTFDNGDWYLGYFSQGQFYKLGMYHFKKINSFYWGTYEDGKMHGEGHYTTPDYTYIGNFENGNFNGKAIKILKSGISEAGRYDNGAQVISYGKLDQ